nr:MAG TPA: hypothetical protein [Caudoviricetes sp.]
MVNLWDYTKKLGRIRILKTDGEIVEGRTVCVTDKDEAETEEDFIVIDLDNDGGIAEIFQSEVESIERI